MQTYILRRLLFVIPTIVGVTIVVSGIVRLLPGDAVDILVDQFQGTVEEKQTYKADLRGQLGLDTSWPEQYGTWAWNALQGDFGTSLVGRERTVWEDLRARIPVTVELGVIAFVVGLIVALPIGVMSALKQDTATDYGGRSFAIALIALPSFWMATLVIAVIIPALGLPALPIRYHGLFDDPVENLKQMWVPGVILGVSLAGVIMRLMRSQMLEVLRQDYVRTARAKGLRERSVVSRHAVKNAVIPVITLIGVQIPILIGGTVVLESIFVLPGLGVRLLAALGARDIPIILAINLFIGTAVVLSNLFVDAAYFLLDPRIRVS